MAAGFAIFCLGAPAKAQLIIEKTVAVNQTIPDRGQYVSTLVWDHAGLGSISRVTVDLVLSSPSATNPMWLGDMFASLTHGKASETERMGTVFNYFGFDPDNSAMTLNHSFTLESQFNGAWLASNRWSLLVADRAQGGMGRLDSWKLTVEGAGADSGIFRPGANGRLAVSTGESAANVGAAVELENGSKVRAEAAAGRTLRLGGGVTGAGDLETATEAGGKVVLGGNSENFTGVVKVGGSGATQLDSVTALGRGTLRQTNGNSVVRLNFAGTLTNAIDVYKVAFATNGATLAGQVKVNNAEFDVAAGNTNTITGAIDGEGGVTKTGLGTLVLGGSTTNTFTGASAVTTNGGTLVLNKTAGTTAISGSSIAIHSGGTLLLGAANQISDGTVVNLAGGTLAVGGNTDTVGRLTLSADSIFDFGTAEGSASSFTFGDFNTSAYNGLSVLTINNAAAGSSLVFNVDYTGNATFNTFASKIEFGTSGQFGQISFGSGQTTLLVAIPDARIAWAAGVLCVLIGVAEWRRKRRRVGTDGSPEPS